MAYNARSLLWNAFELFFFSRKDDGDKACVNEMNRALSHFCAHAG